MIDSRTSLKTGNVRTRRRQNVLCHLLRFGTVVLTVDPIMWLPL